MYMFLECCKYVSQLIINCCMWPQISIYFDISIVVNNQPIHVVIPSKKNIYNIYLPLELVMYHSCKSDFK